MDETRDVGAPPPSQDLEAESEPSSSDSFRAMLLEVAQLPRADAALPRAQLEAGGRIGRFEMVREIGRGGFGVVYEARDSELGRRVALKRMRLGALAEAGDLERTLALFRKEAETIAHLNHPGIVTLHDF